MPQPIGCNVILPRRSGRRNGEAAVQQQPGGVYPAGNVAVTGQSSDASFNGDYYTAKYAAADGALLWEKRYNGPANSDDAASSVVVDSAGNVIVTGISSSSQRAKRDANLDVFGYQDVSAVFKGVK